jgi:trigger factor
VKITVDRLPKSVVTLDIAADPDEFADAVNKTMREVTRDASIPGFRKGKAPRHIIERLIGRDAIVAEAGRNMMDDLYQRALSEQELQPISEPKVDIYNEEPLAFKVLVEVFPKVELGDYRSVRVESREVAIDNDEVGAELDALLKNQAEWVDVEDARQPADGEQVVIDLEVFEGDEQFQEPAKDATFVLGESNLFDSLVEALKMMIPGTSSELTLAFEDDDETVRPSMRGKTLRYAITLNTVRRRDMPELNDEFAARIGEFETVEALREGIAEDILRRKALETRTEVFNEIIEKIVETSEVQVPETLINSELDDQVTQMRTRLAQQGIAFDEYLASNDQTESDLRRDLSAAAEGRVRNTLVLQEVAKAEEMQVTDEDLDAEIDKLVAGRPNPDQLRLLYRSDYFRGMLENELHDRKLMELVVDMATEGRGAITGPGADLLEADQAPPEVEVAEVEEPEAGEAEEDAAEMAAGPADVEADEPGGVDAEADVDDDEPPAEAADGDAVEEAVADDEEADEDEKPGR